MKKTKNVKYILVAFLQFAFHSALQAQYDLAYYNKAMASQLEFVAYFLDGDRSDSSELKKISANTIYSVEVIRTYEFPLGALFVHSNKFVKEIRPAFFRNLTAWINDPNHYTFILDDKPLEKPQILLTLTENDFEGFTSTGQGDKRSIKLILRVDVGINYR